MTYISHLEKGITHFDNRGHGEFTNLKQWLREYQLFHNLLKIPFFAKYRAWKCFSQWRQSVLHAKISSAKRSLEKNLFLVHPILRKSLLQIREKCVEVILEKRLVQVQHGKSYLLEEFATEQKNYVADVSNGYLVEWQESLRKLVEEAGINCLKEKGFSPAGGLNESDSQQTEGLENSNNSNHSDASGHQLSDSKNSGESTKLSKKLTFTEQAARRTECRRLQRFVKLIDYLIVHSLHILTVESACDLLKAVFRGCSDSDVLLSSQNSQDMMDLQMADGKSEMDEADADGNNAALSAQLGGIILGPEVGTKELSESAYDGFPFILSRIAKSAMFKLNVVEVIEEEGLACMDAVGAETDQSLNVSSLASTVHQQQQSNAAASIKKTTIANQAVPVGKDKAKEKPHVPLFKTELLLGLESMQNNLYFAPSLDDFLSLVDNLLKMYLGTAQNVSLLTNTIPYLDPANQDGEAGVRDLEDAEYNEGPRVGAIIMEGTFFREVCGRIRGTLLGIYIGATKWMKTYEQVRNMWVENDKFDATRELEAAAGSIAVLLANSNSQHTEGGIAAILTQYAANIANSGTEEDQKKCESMQKNLLLLASTISYAKDGTVSSPLVGFFEDSLSNFSSQLALMSAIPLSEVIGNLLVLTDKLKNVLLPSPRRCFDEVSEMLPGIARDKNELLLGEVQTWVRILQSPPQTVEGFVEYLGWLEKGKSVQPNNNHPLLIINFLFV
jgi:dynein heavy chain